MRVAAIEVSHWHSLYDAAYLRILGTMPDVELVGLHDPDAAVVGRRAAELGKPPVFTDYREMLTRTKPDFVVALGQHSRMAETAHYLLDQGVAVHDGKAHGVECHRSRRHRREGGGQEGVRGRPAAAALLAVRRPRATAAGRGALRAPVTPLLPTEPADLGALPGVGRAVDARPCAGRRRLPAQPRLASASTSSCSSPARTATVTGRPAQRAGARPARGGLRLGAAAHDERRAGHGRARQHGAVRGTDGEFKIAGRDAILVG